MGLINSMPAGWRLTIKRATTAPVIDPLPDSPAILISNNLVPEEFRYMKIHIFALRWRDEIRRSSQLRTLLKRVVVNRT